MAYKFIHSPDTHLKMEYENLAMLETLGKGFIQSDPVSDLITTNGTDLTVDVSAFAAISPVGMVTISDSTETDAFTFVADATNNYYNWVYLVINHHDYTQDPEVSWVVNSADVSTVGASLTNDTVGAPSNSIRLLSVEVPAGTSNSAALDSDIYWQFGEFLDTSSRTIFRGTVADTASLPDGNEAWEGDLYYNEDQNYFEYWDGTTWQILATQEWVNSVVAGQYHTLLVYPTAANSGTEYQTLHDALDYFSANGGTETPSSTNRWRILIQPAEYDENSTATAISRTVPEYVSIESTESTAKIYSSSAGLTLTFSGHNSIRNIEIGDVIGINASTTNITDPIKIENCTFVDSAILQSTGNGAWLVRDCRIEISDASTTIPQLLFDKPSNATDYEFARIEDIRIVGTYSSTGDYSAANIISFTSSDATNLGYAIVKGISSDVMGTSAGDPTTVYVGSNVYATIEDSVLPLFRVDDGAVINLQNVNAQSYVAAGTTYAGMVAIDESIIENSYISGYTNPGSLVLPSYVTSLGSGAAATSNSAVAVGTSASAGDAEAVAVGANASAGGSGDVAVGQGATTSNEYSIALGYNATSNNSGSLALGYNTTVSKDDSIALGAGATPQWANELTREFSGFTGNGYGRMRQMILSNTAAAGSTSVSGLEYYGATSSGIDFSGAEQGIYLIEVYSSVTDTSSGTINNSATYRGDVSVSWDGTTLTMHTGSGNITALNTVHETSSGWYCQASVSGTVLDITANLDTASTGELRLNAVLNITQVVSA